MKKTSQTRRNSFDVSSLGPEAESRFSSGACSAINRATFPRPKPQERQNFCSIGASDPQHGQCLERLLKPMFFTFEIQASLLNALSSVPSHWQPFRRSAQTAFSQSLAPAAGDAVNSTGSRPSFYAPLSDKPGIKARRHRSQTSITCCLG